MKKYIAILSIMLPLVTNSAPQWFTNNLSLGTSTLVEIHPNEDGTVVLINTAGGVDGNWNPTTPPSITDWFVDYYEPSGPSTETFGFTMPSDVDTVSYTFDLSAIQFSSGASGIVPLSVPEPSAFAVFMVGFGLVFATGMLATGARWVRQLIVGNTETL